MKKICKKIAPVFALMAACLFFVQSVSAAEITSYTYNKMDKDFYWYFPSPNPYNYETSIYAEDLGVDSLYKIAGIFTRGDYVYISAGDKVIIADKDFNTQHVITDFVYNGEQGSITASEGIFVTTDGEIYVCEPSKNRILHFNSDYTVSRILGSPEGMIISGSLSFQPQKVAVDSVGRIYVVANNIYEGIVELNADGTFSRYFGVVEVKYSVMELFWRSIQTDAQRAASTAWLPVNFSNVAIDQHDFVYATVAGTTYEAMDPIRKLNAKGANILRYPSSTKVKPHGDLVMNFYGRNIPTGMSLITAIDTTDFGVYAALDTKRNRVFVYDDDGYMLFAMGESGSAAGRFQRPVDISFMDDKLLVVDNGSMSIEVYTLTDYGAAIMSAASFQYDSDHKSAAAEWERVLDYNQNFQYAYIGIGKTFYWEGDYKTAEQYFKMGQDVDYYSMAFKKNRQEFISNNFGYLGVAIVIWMLYKLSKPIYRRVKARKKPIGGVAK